MAEPTTFIKLHRNILDWRWYEDSNTFRLFVHLLLKANYKDKDWQDKVVERGHLITSISRLSEETGLSIQAVRTSLGRLADTGEITRSSTARYTEITVLNYDKYQSPTNQQQTNNKPTTTTKEVKNNKNTNTSQISDEIPDKPKFEADSNPYKCASYLAKCITERLPNKKITEKQLQSWASDFDKLNRIDGQGWKDIAAVLDFSQSDPFWQVNILSAGKFRKKYDQLFLKMQREDK